MTAINKYKVIDLALLSFLAAAAELTTQFVSQRYSGSGFFLSFAPLITLIAMIRWGLSGIIVGFISAFAAIPFSGLPFSHAFLLYPGASLFMAPASIILRRVDSDDLRESSAIVFFLLLFSYISLSAGKALMNTILGNSFFDSFVGYFLSHLFNLAIIFIVMLLIRKRENLCINMNKYLAEGK